MSEARRNYAAQEFASIDASVRASNFQSEHKYPVLSNMDIHGLMDGSRNGIGFREVFDESNNTDIRRFQQVDLKNSTLLGEMVVQNDGHTLIVSNHVVRAPGDTKIPVRHLGLNTGEGLFLSRVLETSATDRNAWRKVQTEVPDYRYWRAQQIDKMLDDSGKFDTSPKEEDVIALPPSAGPKEIAVYVPQDIPHFVPDISIFPEPAAAQGQQ